MILKGRNKANKPYVVQKLIELRDGVDMIKEKEVEFLDSAEFSNWRDGVIKWLKLGQPYTADELIKFQSLYFAVPQVRGAFDESYGYDDQDKDAYKKACAQTKFLLTSAIENIETDLIPTNFDQPRPGRIEQRGSRQSGVNIGQAGTVVLGDKNTVSVVDTITVKDFWGILEKEVETKIAEVEQKKGVLQKLKELSNNPTFTTLLEQGLGQFLRGYFPTS